jgi:hypothetical protein
MGRVAQRLDDPGALGLRTRVAGSFLVQQTGSGTELGP